MKQHRPVRALARSAAIAALYVSLSLLQDLIFPQSASAAVQFRVAEALCVLALYTPDAVGGLAVGCLLFNLTQASILPLDLFIGTGATLLSAFLMYILRRVHVGKLPLWSLLMPAVCNGLLVGWELWIFLPVYPLWLHIFFVALGELVVVFTLGLALYFALQKVSPRLK